MSRFKECPSCQFQPYRHARCCPRCSHFFEDVAPLSVRNVILDEARRTVHDQPGVELPDLVEHLEARYLDSHELLDRIGHEFGGTEDEGAADAGILHKIGYRVKTIAASLTGETRGRRILRETIAALADEAVSEEDRA